MNKIDKKDLLRFIGIGFLMALLGGVLSGLVDWLLAYINIYISFSLIIIIYFVAQRMRSVYNYYHVIYPILALVLFYFGLIFNDITIQVLNFGLSYFEVYFSPFIFVSVLINPVVDLIIYLGYGSFMDILISIVNLVVYVFAYIYTFKITKGRN